MKIILLENIKGFGQIGDIKNVPDGYGRNFLLPRKMAKAATEGSMKEVDSLKAKRVIMVEAENKNKYDAVICDAPSNCHELIKFIESQGYIPFMTLPLYNENNPDVVMLKFLNKSKAGLLLPIANKIVLQKAV